MSKLLHIVSRLILDSNYADHIFDYLNSLVFLKYFFVESFFDKFVWPLRMLETELIQDILESPEKY